MLRNFLAVSAENAAKGYPKDVPVSEAALYALLGFAVVFLGISLLIFIVWAVGKIISKVNLAQTKAKETKEINKTDNAVSQSLAVADGDEISEETVAVITAAIMAYYQNEQPKCEFKVKRIKKV